MTAKKHAALDRVKSVRGQLNEIIRMLECNARAVEAMKQIQAVHSSLERAKCLTLHNHLETCISDAVLYGRGQAAIDELVDAVKFAPASTGPHARLDGAAVEAAESDTKQLLATTLLSVPGISSQMCKAAIERIVAPIAGVGAVEVDVPAKSITIHHDNRASVRRLIDAIEDEGYHVADD